MKTIRNDVRELPILFNTQMVLSIISEQKTVTRRPLKHKPLPKVGDVLWVRETWTRYYGKGKPEIRYKTQYRYPQHRRWEPSIHLRREHARLFLSVESVSEENVLDITEMDAINEGFGSRDEFLKAWMKLYRSLNMPCHVIRFRWLK